MQCLTVPFIWPKKAYIYIVCKQQLCLQPAHSNATTVLRLIRCRCWYFHFRNILNAILHEWSVWTLTVAFDLLDSILFNGGDLMVIKHRPESCDIFSIGHGNLCNKYVQYYLNVAHLSETIVDNDHKHSLHRQICQNSNLHLLVEWKTHKSLKCNIPNRKVANWIKTKMKCHVER